MIIPIEGVVSRAVLDHNADAYPDLNNPYYLQEGLIYTPKHNPGRFAYWVQQYGDTCYNNAHQNEMDGYEPNPHGITAIRVKIPVLYNPGEPWDPSSSALYNAKYNENYYPDQDCTSLFKIRYRTYYPYIKNRYSWAGLKQQAPWVEMDLTEFNAQGGTKLMDMSEFYLIAKEKPSIQRTDVVRYFHMDVTFDNGKKNHIDKGLTVYSCF